MIEACQEFGETREKIKCRIVEKISAPEEEAENYLRKYWKVCG